MTDNIPTDVNGNPLTPDENGVYPPQNFGHNFWKLMYLARQTGDGSDFDCNTRAGVVTEWRDARPQPTYEEINAVDDALFDAHTENEEARYALADPIHSQIFELINEVRDLKGQEPITPTEFVRGERPNRPKPPTGPQGGGQ